MTHLEPNGGEYDASRRLRELDGSEAWLTCRARIRNGVTDAAGEERSAIRRNGADHGAESYLWRCGFEWVAADDHSRRGSRFEPATDSDIDFADVCFRRSRRHHDNRDRIEFLSNSTIEWNGTSLTTRFVSGSSLLATIPAALLTNAGSAAITVVTAAPGGGISNAETFTVIASGGVQQTMLNVVVNDLIWDPVNQKIYLSLPSANGANGNSVQSLDPVTGTLGATVFAGSEPDLLQVSATSKYLYVALDGASAVQRFTLPGLTPDLKLGLGSDSFDGPFFASDLQASPQNDHTVAIVRGASGVSPSEEGGVIIYDDNLIRPNALCGFIQSGCTGSGGDLLDSIQWNADASMMYAANNEGTGFDFYTIPVTAAGFAKPVDYGGLAGGFGQQIHFDATTKYVYDDNGSIIDPVAGTKVGVFGSSGLMVPDGTINTAFFVSTVNGSDMVLQTYDMTHFTPLNTITIKNVVGTPTHLIRWGTNGLALTTSNSTYTGSTTTRTGAVYILSGAFVH